MRLLNTSTLEMTEFLADNNIPRYAILSHTWGTEEVTFRDMYLERADNVKRKRGYAKIEYCCQQAVRDDLEWAWIDTCVCHLSKCVISLRSD